MNNLYPFLILIVLLASCKLMLGVNETRNITKSEIDDLYQNYSSYNVSILDVNRYNDKINKVEDSIIINNLKQPLLLIYYKNKKVQLFFPNCYAGGFPLLNWNSQNNFDNCTIKQNNTDEILNDIFLDYSMYSSSESLDFNGEGFLLFTNYYLEKQTKNLIDFIEKFQKECKTDYKINLINNDTFLHTIYK